MKNIEDLCGNTLDKIYMKRYVALARVSSREQEREGFSLEVQESALQGFATRMGGTIEKLYRLAETASKRDERKAFHELLAFVQEHAAELDGVLFYKVDRAARNLFDYVELERLEADYGVPVGRKNVPHAGLGLRGGHAALWSLWPADCR